MSWDQGQDAVAMKVNSCFTYLMALKTILMTMAVAGSFKAANQIVGGEERLFAPLGPLLGHPVFVFFGTK